MSSNSRLRTLGDKIAGPGHPVYITGEIGINHNGDLENACRLIDAAAEAGCDAVKFQKRPRKSAPPATSGTSSVTPPGAG
ncbi:N-acetylneuraminate synthase OS=Streptomyces antimycoticus OX=68175 GN=SSPO_058480 PE=4 SV=1 [Streptomyces antimycoticus]